MLVVTLVKHCYNDLVSRNWALNSRLMPIALTIFASLAHGSSTASRSPGQRKKFASRIVLSVVIN